MDLADSRGLLSTRWFHPLVGVLGLGLVAIVAIVDQDTLVQTVIEVLLPVILLLGFLLASRGYVLRRESLTPRDRRRINRWTLLGIGFVGLVAAAFRVLPAVIGVDVSVYEFLGLSAVGAVAGTAVGVVNVRERRRSREAVELKRAIENSSEGISVATADGEFTYVNEAFARMHGYTPAEVFESTWEDLTPEETLSSRREDIRAALDETGSWEGELEGFRRGDGTFPRELSVSRTPEGGVVVIARDITTQAHQQDRIRTLQEAVLELQEASTEREVTEVMVSIAQSLLGEPLTAFFRYDPDAELLVPTAFSEESRSFIEEHDIGAQLTGIPPGAILWEIFEHGDVETVQDYQSKAGATDPDVPLDTFINAPVGDHGVLLAGTPRRVEVSDTDRYVARILAQNAENAYDRVEYEAELEVQNTRLEFLNSLLRHDVLNGMTVIRAHAEELTRTLEEPRVRHAETIVKWSDNVTDLVTRVRTLLNVLTSEAPATTKRVDVVRGVLAEVDRLEGAYPDTDFSVDLPDELPVVADEILYDVVGNVVRNAAEHNRKEDAWVEISASRVDDLARVVVADNGPGIPDDAKDRVFRRGETGHAKESGSGFGLFFVDTMVKHWGGDVWAEDRAGGGTRIVIELPAA